MSSHHEARAGAKSKRRKSSGARSWGRPIAARPDLSRGVRGEDWAECIVHALAGLIGVPTACVRPAVCNERRAVLSRAVQTPDERLEHGNELLAQHDSAYEKSEPRENAGYTVVAVQRVLQGIDAPTVASAPWGAFGVWSGYVLLDAWVAGRDRHHENWAVARGQDHVRLAPSFDHGNALGFAEPERRIPLFDSPGRIQRWCEDGTSPHFAGQPSLVEIACEALNLGDPDAAVYWVSRLRDVRADDVRAILAAVPQNLVSERVVVDSSNVYSTPIARGSLMRSALKSPPTAHTIHQSVSMLRLVWQDVDTRRFIEVGRLSQLADGAFSFQYSDGADHPRFQCLAEFPDRDGIYESNALPAFFGNRVMSSQRESYGQYCGGWGCPTSRPRWRSWPGPVGGAPPTPSTWSTRFFLWTACTVGGSSHRASDT